MNYVVCILAVCWVIYKMWHAFTWKDPEILQLKSEMQAYEESDRRMQELYDRQYESNMRMQAEFWFREWRDSLCTFSVFIPLTNPRLSMYNVIHPESAKYLNQKLDQVVWDMFDKKRAEFKLTEEYKHLTEECERLNNELGIHIFNC